MANKGSSALPGCQTNEPLEAVGVRSATSGRRSPLRLLALALLVVGRFGVDVDLGFGQFGQRLIGRLLPLECSLEPLTHVWLEEDHFHCVGCPTTEGGAEIRYRSLNRERAPFGLQPVTRAAVELARAGRRDCRPDHRFAGQVTSGESI
jgi:hypothetical protein